MKHNILFLGALLLLLCGCRHKEKDPCAMPEDKFGFTTSEYLLVSQRSGDKLRAYEDTFMTSKGNPCTVVFEVYGSDIDSVYWKIGTEVEYRKGRRIQVVFDAPYTNLNVQAIAYRHNDCRHFWQDTAAKELHFLPYELHPMKGRYWGVNTDAPTDSFEVLIQPDSIPPAQWDPTTLAMRGIPQGCTHAYTLGSLSYDFYAYTICCDGCGWIAHNVEVGAWGHYDNATQMLTIRYTYTPNYGQGGTTPTSRTFVGHKSS